MKESFFLIMYIVEQKPNPQLHIQCNFFLTIIQTKSYILIDTHKYRKDFD